MEVKTKYNIADIVFRKMSPEPCVGQVVAIIVSPGHVMYRVAWESDTDDHYDFELSKTHEPKFT